MGRHPLQSPGPDHHGVRRGGLEALHRLGDGLRVRRDRGHVVGRKELGPAAARGDGDDRQPGQQIFAGRRHGPLDRRQGEPAPRPIQHDADLVLAQPADPARLAVEVAVGDGVLELRQGLARELRLDAEIGGDQGEPARPGRQPVLFEGDEPGVVDGVEGFARPGGRVEQPLVGEGIGVADERVQARRPVARFGFIGLGHHHKAEVWSQRGEMADCLAQTVDGLRCALPRQPDDQVRLTTLRLVRRETDSGHERDVSVLDHGHVGIVEQAVETEPRQICT